MAWMSIKGGFEALHIDEITYLLDLTNAFWSDMERLEITRTNANLCVPHEVAVVFDKP